SSGRSVPVEPLELIALACLALLVGLVLGFGSARITDRLRVNNSRAQAAELAENAKKSAENMVKDAELKAKEETIQKRETLEREAEEKRNELREQERRLEKRE